MTKNISGKYNCFKEFVVIDKTLRNFYPLHNCDFGNYGHLFRVILFSYMTDYYASWIVPYVVLAINNPEEKVKFK